VPRKPLRPCAHPGCGQLVERGRCHFHQRLEDRAKDEQRGSANDRLYGYRWQQASRGFLRSHPLCFYCQHLGRITPADCVDHATPHKGNVDRFWDRANWRPSCTPHNSAKRDDDEPTFLASLRV
jgi:5-methylcytosine-specific restriction protein A